MNNLNTYAHKKPRGLLCTAIHNCTIRNRGPYKSAQHDPVIQRDHDAETRASCQTKYCDQSRTIIMLKYLLRKHTKYGLEIRGNLFFMLIPD